jgi:hypothetical protein
MNQRDRHSPAAATHASRSICGMEPNLTGCGLFGRRRDDRTAATAIARILFDMAQRLHSLRSTSIANVVEAIEAGKAQKKMRDERKSCGPRRCGWPVQKNVGAKRVSPGVC